MKYHFYQDAGHGWLKVKKQELQRLGIVDKISHYSYQRTEFVYLEEDRDLSIFMQSKHDFNESVVFVPHTSNKQSKIRTYHNFVK